MGTNKYRGDSYTTEILAIACPFCKVQPYERCKPVKGFGTSIPYPPHKQRVKKAMENVNNESEIQKRHIGRYHISILQEFLRNSGYVLCEIQSNTGEYHPVKDIDNIILRYMGIDVELFIEQQELSNTRGSDERQINDL